MLPVLIYRKVKGSWPTMLENKYVLKGTPRHPEAILRKTFGTTGANLKNRK